MFDLKQVCEKHHIVPRGVFHVGAHEGKELTDYLNLGVKKVVFIEANPVVFQRLLATIAGHANVLAVNCAISDSIGTVTLHVTSMDQSSSILPLKRHAVIYPSIKETQQIVVPSRTIDGLLTELKLSASDYNILNIDIQGAELMAFNGGVDLLSHLDAIFTEVNFEELYEGCPLIGQLDEFLGKHGFVRVEVTTPYHPSWGDAMYVKKGEHEGTK
jgi:FkbM family methyltransferase